MSTGQDRKILFVINNQSGDTDDDWEKIIRTFYTNRPESIETYEVPEDCDIKVIKANIESSKPDVVVAVGGDGTVKLVAECILGSKIILGILPAGSANGMAKELNIDEEPEAALATISNGAIKNIHLTSVNDHLCIHLADVGFNAYLIKKFEIQKGRGMWGYFKAAVKVLFAHTKMNLDINVKGKQVHINAAMVVIANATCYGSGALINPDGSLQDDLFEIVVVKKISLPELFKMAVTHAPYDPEKTEVFQTDKLKLRSKGNVHFQVDGEYLGKVKHINAHIISDALPILVPSEE